jgi:hypothetical protein
MPSRQERRKAERDAAKRAPANARAAGSGAAASAAGAGVNVNVNPVGGWKTQQENPWTLIDALGPKIVEQKAAAGDRAAQYSQAGRY